MLGWLAGWLAGWRGAVAVSASVMPCLAQGSCCRRHVRTPIAACGSKESACLHVCCGCLVGWLVGWLVGHAGARGGRYRDLWVS